MCLLHMEILVVHIVLCNVKRVIAQRVKRNRVKDDCILRYIFSSFVLCCFLFLFLTL